MSVPIGVVDTLTAAAVGREHLIRTRQAHLLGVAGPPEPAPPAFEPREPTITAVDRWVANTAARILAATGPLSTVPLLEAVLRTRRPSYDTITAGDVFRALERTGTAALGSRLRWNLVMPRPMWDRDRTLLEQVGPVDGVVSTRRVIAALTAAGYSAANARGMALRYHPLLVNVRRGTYRLLSN
jgi:hypothetical protein